MVRARMEKAVLEMVLFPETVFSAILTAGNYRHQLSVATAGADIPVEPWLPLRAKIVLN